MLPLKPVLVLVKVPIVAMMNLLWFISTAPIAASMEVIKPSGRRLHPQGETQWQTVVTLFFGAQRLPLQPLDDRVASFHHERQGLTQ
jgi:hypothetical protein